MVRVIAIATLFVLVGGSAGAGVATARSEPTRLDKPSVLDVTDFQRSGRDDDDAIQAAIDAASPGDTVRFGPGQYDLQQPFELASGVNLVGPTGATATLRSADPAGIAIVHDSDEPLSDVTIRDLTLDNVQVKLIGSPGDTTIHDLTLLDLVFTNGAESRDWLAAYVQLSYTEGVTIDGCQFLRSQGHGGRGVVTYKTRLTVIKDSFFGTTPSLEPGTPNGYFRTAINVAGHDLATGTGNSEVVVDGNTWRRTPGAIEPSGCESCQDHGLYAWGTRRLFIVGNRTDGWDTSPAGGGMKLRNLEDAFVIRNSLMSSGILTYVYGSSTMPQHLNRLMIRDNSINIGGAVGACTGYCGIVYWRGMTGGGRPESEVSIRANNFYGTGSINISAAYGPAFCVANNKNALLKLIKSPRVQTAECAAPEWDEPLAGVHRGDFNGDGHDDYVHLIQDDQGESVWRTRISSGSGFITRERPADVYTSPLTAAYGVHVGDFDGDGRDDLTYFGYCGDQKPCWRLHAGAGTSLADAVGWGNGVFASEETVLHGFHTGDFDGDGRDDLVFRGSCGAGEPCWRTLLSTGSGFRPRASGDDVRWALAQDPAAIGLAVGDYDGDGRDDIAYAGVCGKTSDPCFRVHLGGESGFRASSWGSSGYFASNGTSVHVGMRAGDLNGDGRTDLAYYGRCGTAGRAQWRYHVSTGSGFTVQCSGRYAF